MVNLGCPARGKGMTLIELMVSLLLLGTLLMLAAPNLASLILNNRRTAQANNFVAAIQLARSESTKRGRTVTLCASTDSFADDDPATPVPACSNATAWEAGWVVFVDGNDNGSRDAGEPLLQAGDALSGEVTLRGIPSLTFEPSGTTTIPGTFRLCDRRGATESREIVVAMSGRPRLEPNVGGCP